MIRTLCMAFLLLAVLSEKSSAAEKVYKWVDENNVTHFSSRPPMSQKNLEVIPVSEDLDEADPQEEAEVAPPQIELPPVSNEPQLTPEAGAVPAMENKKSKQQPDNKLQGADETKAIPENNASMDAAPFPSVPTDEQLDN